MLMSRLDSDGDGDVDYLEFIRFVKVRAAGAGRERGWGGGRRRSVLLRRKRASEGVGGGASEAAEAGFARGSEGAQARRAHSKACPSAAEVGFGGGASEARTLEGVPFGGGSGRARGSEGAQARRAHSKACPSAAEAGQISGCRGETPRTPPAAGEVAHALGRTCAGPIRTHMRWADPHAHALGRTGPSCPPLTPYSRRSPAAPTTPPPLSSRRPSRPAPAPSSCSTPTTCSHSGPSATFACTT
jgi:hypothetical protein